MIDPHLLAMAMDQSGEAVIITDRRGRIEYANAAFGRIIGITPKEICGHPIADYEPRMAGSDWRQTFLNCVVRKGEVWREEIRERRWSGEAQEQVIDYCTTPVYEHGHIAHFVTIKRDISDRRNLEQQLQQAQKMEVVGTLAGGIAHNFNNILAALSGNVYLLNRMLIGEWDADKARAKLKEMDRVIMRAAEHICGLLSFARKGRMDVKAFSLAPLIQETIKLAASCVPAAIRLETDVSVDDDFLVYSNTTQLQQALLNLINNAVDALEDVEQALVRVEVSAVDIMGKRHACVAVTDNGCGMPKHLLSRVCDPYFTTKQPDRGTGLGLAMVNGMAEQCKGSLSIDSHAGKGTTVRLCLPLAEPDQTSLKQELPHAVAAVSGNGACVLWVDDDDDVRRVGAEVLRSSGFNVLTAADGHEALNVFLAHRADIHGAVLDVIMPRMGGVKTARRMREVCASIPIILMTGSDKGGEAQRACDEGICDHVVNKPVDHVQLAAMLQSAKFD